jgi:hypothetical protein
LPLSAQSGTICPLRRASNLSCQATNGRPTCAHRDVRDTEAAIDAIDGELN